MGGESPGVTFQNTAVSHGVFRVIECYIAFGILFLQNFTHPLGDDLPCIGFVHAQIEQVHTAGGAAAIQIPAVGLGGTDKFRDSFQNVFCGFRHTDQTVVIGMRRAEIADFFAAGIFIHEPLGVFFINLTDK